MDNAKIGNGNISKKIGYSITDEQLQNIATKVSEILDTISENKADKADSLSGYGILDGLSFVEGYADEIDEYYTTNNEAKLYKIVKESQTMGVRGFVPYYLYAGAIQPLVDGSGTELYQYKITSNGILFRKGNRNRNVNTWGSWSMLGSDSGGSGGGSGDMLKAIYDTDGDGIVDNANNANQLGGMSSNAYVTYSSMYNYSYEKSEIDEKLSDEAFLAKLNAVLPNGDEVGY